MRAISGALSSNDIAIGIIGATSCIDTVIEDDSTIIDRCDKCIFRASSYTLILYNIKSIVNEIIERAVGDTTSI